MISKVYKEDDNRPELLEDEFRQIGVDFDGVVHACTKGYHDGTIYDDPIEGSYNALLKLSKKYDIVIYSAKARPDRPLVNGMTGIELIWEWLEKNDMKKFIKDVTAIKPRAIFYIDDRAVRFKDWHSCLSQLDLQ
jgi:hypothetical protein